MIGPVPKSLEESKKFRKAYYEYAKEDAKEWYKAAIESDRELKQTVTEDEFIVNFLMPNCEDLLREDGFEINYDKWIEHLIKFYEGREEIDFEMDVLYHASEGTINILKEHPRLVKMFPVLTEV